MSCHVDIGVRDGDVNGDWGAKKEYDGFWLCLM
jgi:hypothetical protein